MVFHRRAKMCRVLHLATFPIMLLNLLKPLFRWTCTQVLQKEVKYGYVNRESAPVLCFLS